MVSELKGELLCNYEILLNSNGSAGVAGIIVTGPVSGIETGTEFVSTVTAAEFDFASYTSGSLVTVQDETRPILFPT